MVTWCAAAPAGRSCALPTSPDSGHLLATQGQWQGEQLIDPQWLRGHGGGNRSGVSGESTHFTALSQVTTDGIDHVHASATTSFIPAEVIIGPVQVGGQ